MCKTGGGHSDGVPPIGGYGPGMETIGDASGLVSIGQLAKAAGVSSRTIRYYEELGILPEPHRTSSPGQRARAAQLVEERIQALDKQVAVLRKLRDSVSDPEGQQALVKS